MLRKYLKEIPLALGMESKLDEKLVGDDTALEVFNARFPKINAASKRFGLESLPVDILNSVETLSDYGEAKYIMAKNSELFIALENGLFKYSEAKSSWIKLDDNLDTYFIENEIIYDSGNSHIVATGFYNEEKKLSFNTHVEFGEGIDGLIILKHNESNIIYKKFIENTYGISGQTLLNGNDFYGVAIRSSNASTIDLTYVNESGNFTTAGLDTLTGGSYTRGLGDLFANCHNHDTNLAVFAYGLGSGSAKMAIVTTDFSGSNVTYNEVSLTVDFESTFLVADPFDIAYYGGKYFIAYVSGSSIRLLAVDSTTFASSIAEIQVASSGIYEVITVNAYADGQLKVFGEHRDGSTDVSKRVVEIHDVSYTTTFSVDNSTEKHGVCIKSKSHYDGEKFRFVICHDTDLQRTNFLVDENYNVLARMEKGRSTGTEPYCLAQELSAVTDGFFFPNQTSVRYVGETNRFNSGAVSQLTFFKKSHIGNCPREVIGDSIYAATGNVIELDGVNVLENNFHTYPEELTGVADLESEGSDNIRVGTRSYRAVYEHTDVNGKVSRSTPSNVLTLETTTNLTYTNITVPTLKVGRKSESNTRIVLYRTVDNGEIFYRLEPFEFCTPNDSTVHTLTIRDDQHDDDITANEILYSNYGELTNDPAPNCTFLTSGKNRAFACGLEDKNQLAYSKTINSGETVNFSDFLRITVDSTNEEYQGGVTSCAVLGPYVLIFKEKSTFYMTGDGPLNTGLDDTFTTPEILSKDFGCSEPRSVISIPNGVIFKSNQGFFMVNQSLGLSSIGSGVHKYNQYAVKSSVHLRDEYQVRFVLENDYCLVYDYQSDRWNVFTNLNGIDSALYRNNQVILKDNETILREKEGTFSDSGEYYSLRVVTPWIKVSNIQGFQRIWRGLILGEYKSAHELVVRVYHDYDDSSYDEHIIDTISDDVYQYLFHIEHQKCTAIKFDIFDNPTSGSGEGCELSVLTLETGVKRGSTKLNSDKRF